LLLIFQALVLCQVYPQSYDKNSTEVKFSSLLSLINQYYMDSTDLPKLTETAIKSMLKELDPHSVYIPKNDVEKTNEQLAGSFDGIGITYQVFHDSLLVIAVTAGGPSEKAGILSGDRIVTIDGEPASGKKLDENFIYAHLRGKKGTKVTVGIKRYGIAGIQDYTITRDKIPTNTVVAAYMLDEKTGYIRLTRFASPSTHEFTDAMKKLEEQGMENLIFDLRGNSGGYMNVAIDIANEFLPDNKMIVYTKGLRSPVQEYKSNGSGSFKQGRLVVLIDEGSASASEIVSGAVQDWDRALIIGRRSYGKGLVQKPYYLPDGSMVRLTTARYYTPSGRCIQRPYDEGAEKYYKEMNRRIKHGELINADSIRFPDSLKFATPAGRVVYGGGGIMPDIFLAVDSSYQTNYFNELVRKGIINEFCMSYIDRNRSFLKKTYPDGDSFLNNFIVDEKLIADLIALAEKKDLKKDEKQLEKSTHYLAYYIKSQIARSLYDVQVSQQAMNVIDPVVLRAEEVIKSGIEFKRLSMQ
ncbi:MAG: S41 family peptidase, partial [Bacteroidetes bacterium]|nr:S41 family peptidase [Bacteroidota bacterium]